MTLLKNYWCLFDKPPEVTPRVDGVFQLKQRPRYSLLILLRTVVVKQLPTNEGS